MDWAAGALRRDFFYVSKLKTASIGNGHLKTSARTQGAIMSKATYFERLSARMRRPHTTVSLRYSMVNISPTMACSRVLTVNSAASSACSRISRLVRRLVIAAVVVALALSYISLAALLFSCILWA